MSNRKINFSAGPSTLPLEVLKEVQEHLVDYHGAGFSLVEASHRGKEYDAVHMEALQLMREVLNLPANYKVLFLQGGATLQFGMIPMNLLHGDRHADYTLTGTWGIGAHKDAKKVGKVNVVFDGKASNYTTLPSTLNLTPGASYVHLTSNETIGGIQYHQWPDCGNTPVVCDMSSDFLSRQIDVSKFALIYAGAQKNLGPAGMTVVIIRDDLLASCNENLIEYLKFNTHASKDSLFNTPPVFPIWVTQLVLKHIKKNGGIAAIEKNNLAKASALYSAIDTSEGFYRCPVDVKCRSHMNVVWRLPSEELEEKFIKEASKLGMVGLKGHRDVGGIRASIYNAMSLEGVQTLVKFMKEFMAQNR